MKNIFIIVLLWGFLLSGCDITNPKEMTGETIRENVKRSYDNSMDQVNRKEQVGRYNKLWNSKMLFSNTGKGIIEQRDLNGKRIAKLGKGRICAVSEKWLYFQKEKKERDNTIFSVWRLRIDNRPTDQALDIRSAEKVLERTGQYCEIYMRDPYLVMVIDHGINKSVELCIYDLEKKRVLPCDIYTAAGMNVYYMVETIYLVGHSIFISVSGEGIFFKDLDDQERCAVNIYSGDYSCNNIAFYDGSLYFEDGEYLDPPLESPSLKSYHLKEKIVLKEIESNDIEDLMKKQLEKQYKNQIKKLKCDGVFNKFYMDQGRIYIYVYKLAFKLNGKKKECPAVISYDPQKGMNSLTYEKQLTEFLRKRKNCHIIDILQGKVLVQQNKNAYEYDLSTKENRRLEMSDLNYWYIFGRL